MSGLVNQNIGRIVKAKGLRPCRVEAAAGMKRGVISRIIAGKRKVYADEVVPIARALGVELGILFEEVPA